MFFLQMILNMKIVSLKLFTILLLVFIAGCMSTDKKSMKWKSAMHSICVKDNQKVMVPDFLNTIETVFENKGIKTIIVDGDFPDSCKYTLHYTLLQGWDINTYLSYAEFKIYKDDVLIAYTIYKEPVGRRANKWDSTRNQLTPVLLRLLAIKNYSERSMRRVRY